VTTKYTSAWQEQLQDTVQKILNREKFSYDLNADALYRQYQDQYLRQGKQAMTDTMGRAAALTGGYSNSYAQSAGQQAYQSHLQQLGSKVPQLYQIALDRYNAEGSRLQSNAGLLMQQENMDYNRYRDRLSDRDAAFSKLLTLMNAYGYRPTAEEMEAAGMTNAQMKAILGLNRPAVVYSGGSAYNSEVAKRQKELNKLGANLKVDGVYGPKTAAAEKRYGNGQSATKVDADGILARYAVDRYKNVLGF